MNCHVETICSICCGYQDALHWILSRIWLRVCKCSQHPQRFSAAIISLSDLWLTPSRKQNQNAWNTDCIAEFVLKWKEVYFYYYYSFSFCFFSCLSILVFVVPLETVLSLSCMSRSSTYWANRYIWHSVPSSQGMEKQPHAWIKQNYHSMNYVKSRPLLRYFFREKWKK